MQIKLPFDSSKSISGEASIEINRPAKEVFIFVADNFFVNYPKWASEVVDLQPLDSDQVFVGAKAKQIREDNGLLIESIFEITEYQPYMKFIFKGITAPYQHTYIIEGEEQCVPTRLTFKFELLEVEMFMRPFEKLLRIAIEDGAENTIENINNLLTAECN